MFVLWKVKDNEYKLRLNTVNLIALEKIIGKNPAEIVISYARGMQPKVTDIIYTLHSSLQSFEHGFSFEEVSRMYDDYIEAGGNTAGIMSIFVDLFKKSGLIEGSEKN